MDRTSYYPIPMEARRDIAWWGRFIIPFNGTALMWLASKPTTDAMIATDASLKGYGGTLEQEKAYFKGEFPQEWTGANIAQLELLAVLIALKTWGQKLRGMYFWVHVDNEAVANILNTGASRNETLQKLLREVALIAATHDFVIKARHIKGVDNRLPDWLSRWSQPEARTQFREATKKGGWRQETIPPEYLQMSYKW